MKTLYVIALIVVLAVAGIATYALVYLPSQTAETPQLILVYQGNTYSGRLDNSCWPNPPTNGTCTDPIHVDTTGIPPPTSVVQNSSVSFQVVGFSSPNTFRVAIWIPHTVLAIKTVTNSLPITLQAGHYYLSVFALWSDGRGVGYTFEISVS